MVIAVRNAGLPLFLSPLLLAACAVPPATQYGPAAKPSVAAAPGAAAKSVRWNGVFSCTAHADSGLPAIILTRVPFRQEGDRLSGLYTFTDHFKYENSVVFSGSLLVQRARTSVTPILADGSPTSPAEMSGPPAM